MAKFAWTPQSSQFGLGSILLPSQPATLNRREYQLALAGRINRMLRAEGAEAVRLLQHRAAIEENLDLGTNTAAIELVENSSRLSQMSGFPLGLVRDLEHEPETLDSLETEDLLEEYVNLLYSRSAI